MNLKYFIYFFIVMVMIGCSKEEDEWKLANEKNTIKYYTDYIQKYPSSKNIQEAKLIIVKLLFTNLFYDKSKLPKSSNLLDSYFSERPTISSQTSYVKIDKNSIMQNPEDVPQFWNGHVIDSLLWEKISYDLEMGGDMSSVPIPGKTMEEIQLNDMSIKMNFSYTFAGYVLNQLTVKENSILKTKNGITFKYKGGHFE